jgi:hypothetical protein
MSNQELDKDYIKSKILEILKSAHPDPRKWRIKEFPDRLQYSCPQCGDSESAPGQKLRGVLYFKNLMHICFNEQNCNCSFNKLLDIHGVPIDLQKKLDIYNYIDTNTHFSKNEDTFILHKLDKLIDIDFLTEFLNTHPETQFSNFSPIKTNSAQYQYLKYDRLIDKFDNIYQADFIITTKWTEKVIVILNKSGKKVLGMQTRNMKPGNKRIFKIFNFEKLYNMVHPDEQLDEIEAISYNKISNFFNILNVDWNNTVTVFEGMLDATFYPNSIGAIGLNSINEMEFITESEDLDLQFFFDQDNVGVRKSVTMLEKGHKVFLWQKLVENLIKNKTDKYKAKNYALKIKDLNNLAQEMKNNDPYTKLKLNKYFSNDIFDKLYLDYTLYNKNKK